LTSRVIARGKGPRASANEGRIKVPLANLHPEISNTRFQTLWPLAAVLLSLYLIRKLERSSATSCRVIIFVKSTTNAFHKR
jgi:hypothetical protein